MPKKLLLDVIDICLTYINTNDNCIVYRSKSVHMQFVSNWSVLRVSKRMNDISNKAVSNKNFRPSGTGRSVSNPKNR